MKINEQHVADPQQDQKARLESKHTTHLEARFSLAHVHWLQCFLEKRSSAVVYSTHELLTVGSSAQICGPPVSSTGRDGALLSKISKHIVYMNYSANDSFGSTSNQT